MWCLPLVDNFNKQTKSWDLRHRKRRPLANDGSLWLYTFTKWSLCPDNNSPNQTNKQPRPKTKKMKTTSKMTVHFYKQTKNSPQLIQRNTLDCADCTPLIVQTVHFWLYRRRLAQWQMIWLYKRRLAQWLCTQPTTQTNKTKTTSTMIHLGSCLWLEERWTEWFSHWLQQTHSCVDQWDLRFWTKIQRVKVHSS